jgi:hypothetical protein
MIQNGELETLVSSLPGFRLIREIGRGGMGAVFLAEETRLQRPVAIKVLLATASDDADTVARFLREARTAAQLSHPNIVSVLRAEEVDNRLIIVMPYVDGDTLAEKIQARGSLPPAEVAQILREIAWALGYAHGRGIIHRDVKPENVIIERGTSRAQVTDFGIAHNARAESLTKSGIVLGTVHYMSPEQANGDALTGASDLYSLAVMGYFALTGAYPIDGPSAAAVLVRHATTTPTPIRAVRPEIPEAMAAAIDRCLAKDPSDRFPTAEAFADALGTAASERLEIPPLVRVWIAQSNIVLPILMMMLLVAWWNMPASVRIFFGGLGDISATKVFFAGLFFVFGIVENFALYSLFIEPFGTRRLIVAGFGLEDIRYGLQTELRQHREEREANAQRRSMTGKILRALGVVWVAFALGSIMARPETTGAVRAQDAATKFVTVLLCLWYVSSVLGAGTLLRRARLRLWMGSGGRLLVRLARIGLAKSSRSGAGA